jgi:hypothetical protein
MTGKRWLAVAVLAGLAAVDWLATRRAHHAPGAVTSLRQVIGWAVFVALVAAVVITLAAALLTAVHHRRYRRTYERLRRSDDGIR